jgi:beta-mannosidase
MGDDIMADHPGRSSAMFGIGPILYKFDPERDFLPSSPYGGSFFASNTAGTTHNTQYLSYIVDAIDELELCDYKDLYKKLCARFIAEEPTFGLVSTDSLKKFLSDEDIFTDNVDMMRYHTKTNPAMKKEIFDYFLILAEKILGKFKDANDRNFKLRYIQHECVRVSLEQLRRETWFCSGVIFWMLADCWPAAAGWTFLDYYVMPKASYYSFKRCSKPVVCSIDKNQNTYSVYVCNNNLSDVNANTNIFVIDAVTSEKQLVKTVNSKVFGQTSDVIYTFDYNGEGIVVAENEYDRSFYKKGALNIAKKDIEYKIEQNKIILTSCSYIQAVEIEGEVILTDNWFSMLPGETRVIEFEKINTNDEISVIAYGIEV